jgi:hypothetical protein
MFRKELPRVYELRDLIEDPTAPGAYFQGFDNLVRDHPDVKQYWLAREEALRALDQVSWDFLKNEVRPYLICRDPERGWHQLFAILNQAYAYNYLNRIGCSNVRFIPPATQKRAETPDLEAELNSLPVLCEVKTINISDDEAVSRVGFKVRVTTGRLESGFFNKLASDLIKAKHQLDTYIATRDATRIVYLVPNFDDLVGDCKQQHFNQIDHYLAENPVPGIEVVFHNQKTPIHKSITMTAAEVVNE